MRRAATDVLAQLHAAGLRDYITYLDAPRLSEPHALRGRMRIAAIQTLRKDPRFASGPLHQLHKDVGEHRIEFRAHPGEVGDGSLQIVFNRFTGDFYADIDRFNPYSDLVNSTGHAGEVVVPWFKKIAGWFRKKKDEPRTGDEVV